MPEKAKTLYHSGLKRPTTLTVTSDALRSKFGNKSPEDAGYEYIFVEIGGEKYAYSAENRNCASFLAGYKDQTITVQAIGSREDAQIVLADADASQDPADREKQAKKAVVGTIKDEIQRTLNVMWLVEKAVTDEIAQALLSGVSADNLSAENFGGKCAQVFKRLEKKGFVESTVATPLWSVENSGVE